MILRRLLGLLLLLAWAVPAAAAPRKASLTLQWYPQTQFAGYYMALAKGFYQRRGIDLTLRRGRGGRGRPPGPEGGRGPSSSPSSSPGAPGLPLPGAAPGERGADRQPGNVLIVAKKKSRILKVEDLNGRRMSLWGGPLLRGLQAALRGPEGGGPWWCPSSSPWSCSSGGRGRLQRHVLQRIPAHPPGGVASGGAHGDLPAGSVGATSRRTGSTVWSPPGRRTRGSAGTCWRPPWRGGATAAAHPDEAVALLEAEADRAGYTVNSLLLRRMLLTILSSVFPSGKDRWTPGRLSREDYERTVSMMAEGVPPPGGPGALRDLRPLRPGPGLGRTRPEGGSPPCALDLWASPDGWPS